MRARLRRRVTLLSPARTETGGGGAETSFTEAGTVWAEVAGRSAGESGAGGRLHSRAVHELTLRFGADAAPGWRARWGGREARVVAVFDPDGLRRTTILICEDEE